MGVESRLRRLANLADHFLLHCILYSALCGRMVCSRSVTILEIRNPNFVVFTT